MYQFSPAHFIKEPVSPDQQSETQSVPQTLVLRWLGECAMCLAAMWDIRICQVAKNSQCHRKTNKQTHTLKKKKVVTGSMVFLYFSQRDIWS